MISAEFIVHTAQIRPEPGEVTNVSGPADQTGPQSPAFETPNTRSQPSPPTVENQELSPDNEAQSDMCTPTTGVRGRGPMLPRIHTDKDHESDPSMAEEDTYDDTPPQGWKKLSDVYDEAPQVNLATCCALSSGDS
ncbi:hypothetical protein E3N88_06395 [Mikania micrantha]|uniref:Uncharacterized protein n=1 Tax=Mikania micrantha TaxID=192012 RepID=A0A5N6PRK4_9ASTR|nr:hypothetical protein E3N88_06395 [Mikania micrantha]